MGKKKGKTPEETQGPSPGVVEPGPSQGFRQRGPTPGFSQQGPPPGFSQQGPPPGFSQQGPPPGFSQRGPPPGFRQQGPRSGFGPQGQPRYVRQRGPPLGFEQEGAASSLSGARGSDAPAAGKKQGEKSQGEPGPSGQPFTAAPSAPVASTSKASPTGDESKVREIVPYVGKYKIPKRRGQGGRLGRPVTLEVNYLPLKIRLDGMIVHYDCAIDPDKPKAVMPKVFEKIRLLEFPGRHPAFDGRRNMYSCGEIKFKNGKMASGEVSVMMDSGSEKVYKYTIKEANRVFFTELGTYMKDGASTKPASVAIQALDIALRSTPVCRSLQVGRSFFNEPRDETIDLGEGMVLWSGYFQSAILASKPYLNVDVAHKAFPKPQTVLEYMQYDVGVTNEELSGGLRNRATEEKIRKFLKGIKVKYTIPGPGGAAYTRAYKVNDISTPPATIKFSSNGVNTNVKDYFMKEKKYKIKYDQLPCLHVGARDKNIHIPIELCSIIKGQAVMKQLTERQTSNMVRQAATKPFIRKKKVIDSIRLASYRGDPCLKEFGIEVDEKFEKVSARVLDPPALEYKGGKIIKPERGQWKAEGAHFYKCAEINSWVVLNLCSFINPPAIENMVSGLIKSGRDAGVACTRPTIVPRPPFRSGDENSLRSYMNDLKKRAPNTQMVLVIMENVYAQVKRAAEIHVGILTQCIKGGTVKRFNYSIAYNMMLKINTKLNGVNHVFSSMTKPPKCIPQNAMVIGSDVTHPSPDKSHIPSIAAVAASYDKSFVHHNIISRLQGPKMEIIDDFANIMKEQLQHYYLRNGKYPERLFFFRDGVSEGQFAKVLDHELVAARKACSDVRQGYKPQITFLVVQKRHHARLFLVNERDGDRNGNVQPGTIVDRQIVHPTEMEYFLTSHASIQGTSRPTKYHVLWDESDMTEDELEHLTYYLCYVFARCNRSVSYPAPTYNAHLAAFRSRSHIEGLNIDVNNLSKEQHRVKIIEQFHKSNPMFFV